MNSELQNYIQKMRDQGYPDDQIRQALKKAGWRDKDIAAAFGEQEPLSGMKPLNDGNMSKLPKEKEAASASGSKSFLVAFLLSLFLGILGVDRFYLGRIGTGILKLVTIGGFGVWYVIDFILIFAGKLTGKDGLELEGREEHKKIAAIILVVVLLIQLATLAFNIINVVNFSKALNNGIQFTSTTEDGVTTNTTTIKGDSENEDSGPASTVALGDVFEYQGMRVRVADVDLQPQTQGAEPDAGSRYIVASVERHNTTDKTITIKGDLKFLTDSGDMLHTATTGGTQGYKTPGKNVEAIGAGDRMVTSFTDPGETIQEYMIFQIPENEFGKLAWFKSAFDDEIIAYFELQ